MAHPGTHTKRAAHTGTRATHTGTHTKRAKLITSVSRTATIAMGAHTNRVIGQGDLWGILRLCLPGVCVCAVWEIAEMARNTPNVRGAGLASFSSHGCTCNFGSVALG